MKYAPIYKAAFVFVVLIVIAGCDFKPQSAGNLDEIIVFADSMDWNDYKPPIDSVFGRLYQTPVMESEYVLSWQPADDLEKFKYTRNIFFLGRMNSDGAVSTLVRNSLSEDIINNVNSGKYFYIPKHDPWATDQYVLFLLAPNKEELINRIYKYSDAIYDDFEKSYYERFKEELFKRYENEDLEEYLVNHFPFTMRIPSDYFIAHESVDSNFVWIRRLEPDRSVMVHWVPYSDTIDVNYKWIVKERNKVADMIYEGDVIVEGETKRRTVRFLKWQALRLEGTWMNPKYMIGGPFRNITFVDSKSNLIFMIDFYVRAIGQRKKMYLDQLDIMAHTFQSKARLQAK
jgi:hypothetical protein